MTETSREAMWWLIVASIGNTAAIVILAIALVISR